MKSHNLFNFFLSVWDPRRENVLLPGTSEEEQASPLFGLDCLNTARDKTEEVSTPSQNKSSECA